MIYLYICLYIIKFIKNVTTPLPQIGVKIDNGNNLRKNSFSK